MRRCSTDGAPLIPLAELWQRRTCVNDVWPTFEMVGYTGYTRTKTPSEIQSHSEVNSRIPTCHVCIGVGSPFEATIPPRRPV